jgi:hypothetical protein
MPESQSLPDLRYTPARPRAELITAIREQPDCLGTSLRIVAENILGAGSTIDLVAADREGRLLLVLVGVDGEDMELFTRAIAQRAWVTPRIADWIQLAPGLALRANAPVRALLLSPVYRAETVAAAEAIGPDIIGLATYRWVQAGPATRVLIDLSPRESEGAGTQQGLQPGSSPGNSGGPGSSNDAGGTGARFRTGLTEDDLNLSPQEARDFD